MNDKIAGKFRGTGIKAGLMYGMAEFYGGGAFVIINTFFLVFLTKALGMPAALADAIPMVGKVWDAITDPIMGNITDRTTSKFGHIEVAGNMQNCADCHRTEGNVG